MQTAEVATVAVSCILFDVHRAAHLVSAAVQVRLEVRPLEAGTLTLRGVQWALNGTALGRRNFAPRPPRRKSSR